MSNKGLKSGDVVFVQKSGWGLLPSDANKYVELVDFDSEGYDGYPGWSIKEYDSPIETSHPGMSGYIAEETFGDTPFVLLNTKEDGRYLISVGSKQEVGAALGIDRGKKEQYTGGSSNYYKVFVKNPTTLEEPYEAECNDIIESLKMTFAEGNAFKAIWRKAKARQGVKKKGYDNGLYDSEKVVFFGERMAVEAKYNNEDSGS